MIGAKGQIVHFVNGVQLCREQYAEYRHNQGREEGQKWMVEKIARFNQRAENDKAFRNLVLTYLGLN